jgi:hypothetical protein
VRDVIMKKHPHVKSIEILVGSNDDPASLEAVASQANTVLSFAGTVGGTFLFIAKTPIMTSQYTS